MGFSVHCGTREVWLPSLTVGFLYLDQVQALERAFKVKSGVRWKIGGASRDRTDDLIVANDDITHSQLTDKPCLRFSPVAISRPIAGSITEAQRGRSVCLKPATQGARRKAILTHG